MNHPMQPIYLASDSVIRFRHNPLVTCIQRFAASKGFGLDELKKHLPSATDDDWQQLAQLLGYSVSGFGDLSYANPDTVQKADAIAVELIREGKK